MNNSLGASETNLKDEYIFVLPGEMAVENESNFTYENHPTLAVQAARVLKFQL